MSTVRFVTRRNCHLCDDALPLVRRRVRRLRWELEVVDVDDAGLVGMYGDRVPVVLIDGVEVLAGLFGRREVRAALK